MTSSSANNLTGPIPAMFEQQFESLTCRPPMSWQTRLFYDHFAKFANDELPSVIDLPTGLGKTMVMAIWLIARSKKDSKLPRRLIYVVDRRTVVDQATDLAEDFAFLLAPEDAKTFQDIAKRKPKLVEQKRKFADTLCGLRQELGIADTQLAISTLRGQLADNREWSKDLSRPAIIIGTVDLIGSGLLFSGYRSSYKRRPLEAGLLGQDSLLVLDEAHLSRPFEKLITSISCFQKAHGNPVRVIRMSATSASGGDQKAFRLDTDPASKHFDLWSKIEDGKETNPIKVRFEASKRLTIKKATDVVDAIATEAGKLSADKPGSRIVIFVRSPKDVEAVRKALVKKDKTRESKIAVLTGTMRGLERDELVTPPERDDQHARRVMQRFLNADNEPLHGECFLISTSAGEVGFDLNADQLVGDAAPLDSWIQRLGRVNRRGSGDATVILVREIKPADKTDFDKACKETSELFHAEIEKSRTNDQDGMDVSPEGLAVFKASLTCEKIEQASSPRPTTVELTDILLDAWSMTSILEPMPGRPEVGPWLRGISEWEPPQTTIAWRAELDEPGFADLDLDDIEEWFDTHRILTHETLAAPTTFAAKELLARWSSFDATEQADLGSRPVVVDRAGIKAMPLAGFMRSLERDEKQTTKTYDTIRYAEVVLPAAFGGIRRGLGLLDAAEPKLDKDEEKKSREERDAILNARRKSIDVADIAPSRKRQRIIDTFVDGEKLEPRIIGGGEEPKPKATLRVELQSDDDDRTCLVSCVPRREKLEWGTKIQTLAKHVGLVRQRMDELLNRLDLPATIKMAAQLAADYHDHGKNREFFQRIVGGTRTATVEQWQAQSILEHDGKHQCLGKSGGTMKRDPRGYRHEFGSLREFMDVFNAGKLPDDVFDLAMHLIATHHGRSRPHFPRGAFDPDCERRSGEIHTEAIRRFARLQRKYGWWQLAWLENLLRCADALASADRGAEDESAALQGDEP